MNIISNSVAIDNTVHASEARGRNGEFTPVLATVHKYDNDWASIRVYSKRAARNAPIMLFISVADARALAWAILGTCDGVSR